MSEPQSMIIVSSDTHIGPRLVEDLRPYCPSQHLDEFDDFASNVGKARGMMAHLTSAFTEHPNFQTPGHYDSASRLADYDYDGITAGVMFHGSENFQPIPFVSAVPGKPIATNRELVGVGQEIYNRWLADFVSQAPDRHLGVALLPIWDVEQAVAETERWHDAGLRGGVILPALRGGDVLEYNNPAWERLWAVCEERRIPLITHVGAADPHVKYEGPEATAIIQMESGSFFSHRTIWWLLFAGVFERFPELKLVITETPGLWFRPLSEQLDGIWRMYRSNPEMNAAFLKKLPRKPSEYMATNVFIGASFASPYEANQAVEKDFVSNLMWGSDYPHIEGTFVYPKGQDKASVTRLALRNTFCDVPAELTRRMVSDNMIELYGLDREKLQKIADSIDAPTAEELATPIGEVPEGASQHAFRSGSGAWS